jgi:hypothetical protein
MGTGKTLTTPYRNQKELKLAYSSITITWFKDYGRVKKLGGVVSFGGT